MCLDSIYNDTYQLLKNFKMSKTTNRANVSGLEKRKTYGNKPKLFFVGRRCESMNFGLVRKRFGLNGNKKYKVQKQIDEGNNNFKYPDIYKQLQLLIKSIDPTFKYNTITLNHNLLCLPHKDKHNKSPSLIVAFGDFLGGELVLDCCEFDINRKPLIMNGSNVIHWTNNFIGDRYSVIYYNI